MKFGKLKSFMLTPSMVLKRYHLSFTTERIFARAAALAMERGCGRLTTSLLLFAMVEFGERDEAPSILRSVWRYTLGSQPEAYRGIQRAYYGWYERSCGESGRGSKSSARETLTGYITSVLHLAEELGNPIEPEHLLAALLDFDPGAEAIQPGVLYILSLLHPDVDHRESLLGLKASQPPAPGSLPVSATRLGH